MFSQIMNSIMSKRDPASMSNMRSDLNFFLEKNGDTDVVDGMLVTM